MAEEKQRKRSSRKRIVVRSLVLLMLAAAGIWAFRHLTRPEPVAVAVKSVTRGTVERTVANTRAGTVKACRRAKLSPSIGGQISSLPVQEGDRVKAGDLLLELWNQDIKAQVQLAQREVTAARSHARSVCARSRIAYKNAQRASSLLESKVGTIEQTENTIAEADALAAECEGAQKAIGVREAQLAVARATLDRTRLTAPFDGVIGAINGEQFEFVTPSPLGVPTPPVIDIIATGCYYVIAPIDEVDVADIRVSMPARITMDAYGDRVFPGRVRRVADYVLDVEKQARTVDVEVTFDRPEDDKALLAGYSADIEVIIETRSQVLRVPTEAVTTDQFVYVFYPEKGIITKRRIQSGLSNWDFTEITKGLEQDELVVVNIDASGLKDGAAAVLIKEPL